MTGARASVETNAQAKGEPAAIVAAIQVVLVMLVSFGALKGIGIGGQDAVAVVMVVVNAAAAVYLAWSTHNTLLAPVVELFKALLGLAAIYGFHLTTEQTGSVIMVITVAFGLFNRQVTSPLAKGNFRLAA